MSTGARRAPVAVGSRAVPEPADDPLHALEHDHAGLHRSIVELTSVVGAVQQGGLTVDDARSQLTDLTSVLAEDLFAHFSREEEVLFPYVLATVPDMTDSVLALVLAHDGVCGTVARLSHLVQSDAYAAQLPLVGAIVARLAGGYAEHSRQERALLASLDARLTPAQRAELTELSRGL